MAHKICLALLMLMGMALSAACSHAQINPTQGPNMPNPASVYCEQQGGKLNLTQDASGGVSGMCIFPDGSACDEWAYFRGECKPGDSLAKSELTPAPQPSMPNPASAFCEQQGYQLKIVTAVDGSQSGVCVFPDGSTCDEWAFSVVSVGQQSRADHLLQPGFPPPCRSIQRATRVGGHTPTRSITSRSCFLKIGLRKK